MKQILLFVLILSCCTLCLSASPFWGNAQQSASKGLATRTDNETFVFSKGGNPFLNWSSHRICAGVNIHFVTGHEQDLDMIAAAGFKFVRIDFGWQGIERQKGEYNWKAFDELTANLEKRGLGGLYILDYSNSLYEETSVSKNPLNGKEQKAVSSPQHDESVAAFARWSAAAAAHFKGKNIVWEIWNEPNISFWKPKPDVKQYTALALATCKAVKAAVPEATIIGPASSELPWPYLESFFSSGVLEYLDAVSIHPYRNYSKSPETAVADYQKLRALVGTYAPQTKKNMPIISSEWGYSTALKALPLETQAAFIVRMQLSNLLAGIPVSTWYDWKNDGTDPNDWEQNFGTVTNDLVPKPSYNAIKLMNMQ
ncbi:MAG: cellulase family glycosylhydrolase, partial [Bacteroidota bacterium]|nr:cellulase family glycosylhydrolase [Bacteroidota bacterium]